MNLKTMYKMLYKKVCNTNAWHKIILLAVS